MALNVGMIFGDALSSGVTDYMALKKLQMQVDVHKQAMAQAAREDTERAAAAAGAQGTTTAVTPATLASQMQGADGKADPDAVLGTYGAIQDPTQAPSVTKNLIAGGVQQGQMANADAGQGQQPIQYASQSSGRAPLPPAGGIPSANSGSGPQGGYDTPTGNGVQQATQYVMGQEGGYVPNDNGKGPTNYGINGQANGLTPDQVKNLTPDQAAQIYQTKYFSGAQGGVDISKLPPTAAVAVGDTAANMGQGTASSLWQQSGGDLNKFLDLRQKQYDSIQAPQSAHDAWNNRMASIREFVNNHGTSETVPGDSSGMPVAPQTKVTMLKADPISPGATGIGQSVQFTHDANGNVQMTQADTAADALQRMATKAFQIGDIKNGPTLMNAAIQARAAQAQQQVSSILTNDKMDQDQKVAQLANLAGAKAFKTENGNYLIPGLGPVDGKGNPMPMSLTQVASLSSQMASPDGLHHIIDTQIAMQKAGLDERAADQKDTENAINQQKADATTALNQADAKLKQKQGDYYETNANATNANKNAQAQQRQEEANIRIKLQDLEQQVGALNPSDPQYQQKVQQIRLQHDMLISRLSGRPGSTAEPKPQKMVDGETNTYTLPDGSRKSMTWNAGIGREIPSDQEPRMRQGVADIKADPDTYKGVMNVSKGGAWGFALDPTVAKNYGLNPDVMYRTPQEAVAALRGAPVKRNPAPAMTANQVPGIPDVQGNPTAAIP